MRQLLRCRRANAATLFALMAVPLIGAIGIAVDLARAWLVQSRLTTAIDAAALTGARDIALGSRNAEMVNLFWANFARSAPTSQVGFMGATVTGPTITQVDQNTMSVSAQASLPTTFMRLFGIPTMTAKAADQSARATQGLEIALVLDNTGSMAGWPIGAVITAATQLTNVLYGHNPSDTGSGGPDTEPNLWMSIVPFTAEVNIGPTNTGWLAAGSLSQTAYQNTTWMGCVMARTQNSNDFTDASPSTAPFTPFLYPSTLGKYMVGKTPITGDDDWSPSHITEGQQSSLPQNTAVGPNLGCPPLPVLGLQPSRNAALSLINKMVAVFRGGTFINLGLQAGWWTLSPNWRGLWGNPALPLNYNTPNMQKVIVLMTDGNNEWYDWSGGAPGAGPSPWKNDGDTDFTAYGRLKQDLMGLSNNTQANATANINARMSQMCTIIKSHNIILYTILFNHDGSISSATQALFQACASSPSNYFLTPSAADLETAFSQIGSKLVNLRLTQ
jgi:Flp pilus assembly protein TadG